MKSESFGNVIAIPCFVSVAFEHLKTFFRKIKKEAMNHLMKKKNYLQMI